MRKRSNSSSTARSKRFFAALILASALRAVDAATVQPSVVYDGSAFADLSGGLRTGRTYLGTARVRVTGTRVRTSVYVEVLNAHGGTPSDFAGDAQGVSNLAAPRQTRIEELWIQQNFFGSQLSVLAGRYDLNSEFYRLQSAGLFLNSSFGVGPEFSGSGRHGPSIYPNTASAIRIQHRPKANVVLRAALFKDLALAEISLLSRPGRDMPRDYRFRLGRLAGLPAYTAKISVGGWHYTNGTHSSGAYILGDRTLYEGASSRVAAFGQFGVGDARSDRFGRYLGGGIVLSRSRDEIGVAIASGRDSGVFNVQQNTLKGERTIEVTYLTALNRYVAVQPDLQYVVHPSAVRDRNNALVMLLRFEISR